MADMKLFHINGDVNVIAVHKKISSKNRETTIRPLTIQSVVLWYVWN